MARENTLLTKKHILIYSGQSFNNHPELEYLNNNFCGIFATSTEGLVTDARTLIYLCGDISSITEAAKQLPHKAIYAVCELSKDYDGHEGIDVIGLGCVPINVHGAGVLFRKLFEEDDYDQRICEAHTMQKLTESDKPNNALREGMYLSRFRRRVDGVEIDLMRCSSNFSGPTKKFQPVDEEIVTRTNDVTADFFKDPTELNHILAQTYHNSPSGKAKISKHADKTEDMGNGNSDEEEANENTVSDIKAEDMGSEQDPISEQVVNKGVIAFCSFYKHVGPQVRSQTDPFDVCYRTTKGAHKSTSVLTTLYFSLKDCVKDESLVKEFTVKLYPNSVFIIPLSTNRLYTHETRPSVLPFNVIPVRTSFVIKCSITRALHKKDGQIYISHRGQWRKLMPMTRADLTQLRTLYFLENTTADYMNYPFIGFSANGGDYMELEDEPDEPELVI